MTPPRIGADLELLCVDWDRDGFGVCPREDGGTVHVPAAVPGDRVLARIEHQSPHRDAAWARLVRVLTASADRVATACPNIGACGGCLLQPAAYPRQLRAKQERVTRALAALGCAIAPVVPSPMTLGYRNKAKLVAAARGHEVYLGSYAPGSHQVVDMAGCRVVEPVLDRVAQSLARLASQHGAIPYDERARAGELRYAILRSNFACQVLLVLVLARDGLPWAQPLAHALVAAHPEVVGVVADINPRTGGALLAGQEQPLVGATELAEQVGPVRLLLPGGAFFQVNRAQASALYTAVRASAALEPDEHVVDAYAGVGGIALTLLPDAGRVTAIEYHPGAAEAAERAATGAPAGRFQIVRADVATGLGAIGRADVVVLNPPRKGCAPAVLRGTAALRPRRIVYVSCDPESLARDLLALRELGYPATSARPFDLLPHTPHVETLTVCDASPRAA
jgi:23S rRNA (uracil1939-C5)-methyltransferase